MNRLVLFLAAAAAVTGCADKTAAVKKSYARTEVLWTRQIVSEPGRYIGWPTVIALKDGTLAAVFSGDRDDHTDPYGKVQFVKSLDGGETWSRPMTLANSIIDDRDAGIVQLPDGELVVSWFTSVAWRGSGNYRQALRNPTNINLIAHKWLDHDQLADREAEKKVPHNLVTRSKDGGWTWTEPEKFCVRSTCPHGPSLMKDGSLIQVGFRSAKDGGGKTCTHLTAEKSTDGGRTWTTLCEKISTTPWNDDAKKREPYPDEPFVRELPSGKLVVLIRWEGGDGYLRQSESIDGGRTWSEIHRTEMRGFPAYMTVLESGRLLAVYSRRDPEKSTDRGIFACVSDDEGASWKVQDELCLSRVPPGIPGGHFGYPSTAINRDGTFVTVYYQTLDSKTPQLWATKWCLAGE